MPNGLDNYPAATDAVQNDVGCSGYQQFPHAGNAAGSAKVWMMLERLNYRNDTGRKPLGSGWLVCGNVGPNLAKSHDSKA